MLYHRPPVAGDPESGGVCALTAVPPEGLALNGQALVLVRDAAAVEGLAVLGAPALAACFRGSRTGSVLFRLFEGVEGVGWGGEVQGGVAPPPPLALTLTLTPPPLHPGWTPPQPPAGTPPHPPDPRLDPPPPSFDI